MSIKWWWAWDLKHLIHLITHSIQTCYKTKSSFALAVALIFNIISVKEAIMLLTGLCAPVGVTSGIYFLFYIFFNRTCRGNITNNNIVFWGQTHKKLKRVHEGEINILRINFVYGPGTELEPLEINAKDIYFINGQLWATFMVQQLKNRVVSVRHFFRFTVIEISFLLTANAVNNDTWKKLTFKLTC